MTPYQRLRAERDAKWAKSRARLIERHFFSPFKSKVEEALARREAEPFQTTHGIRPGPLQVVSMGHRPLQPIHVQALRRQLYALKHPELRFRCERLLESGWIDARPIGYTVIFSDPEHELLMRLTF